MCFIALKSSINYLAKYTKPVDAIKASLKMNQKGGFDCPGCAWPDPDEAVFYTSGRTVLVPSNNFAHTAKTPASKSVIIKVLAAMDN